jgi:hypothetical protein
MGQQLPSQELELYRRCDEVLHYIWDPCGVAGAPGARDEYYGYLPQVFAYVQDQAASTKIVDYLVSIEEKRMGLSPRREHAQLVANMLTKWREWIMERAV